MTRLSLNRSKFAALALTMSALSFCPTSTYADEGDSLKTRVDALEQRVQLLETVNTVYGPITISQVHLGQQNRFLAVEPGQTVEASFKYLLDSSQQEFLTKNHLIVGIKGVAAEVCATHLYGVWDSTGTAKFNLVAPLEAGDYEVRIAYRPGDTCQDAINTWNVLEQEPSSYATIGILRVAPQS